MNQYNFKGKKLTQAEYDELCRAIDLLRQHRIMMSDGPPEIHVLKIEPGVAGGDPFVELQLVTASGEKIAPSRLQVGECYLMNLRMAIRPAVR